jgi:hypothetical protein
LAIKTAEKLVYIKGNSDAMSRGEREEYEVALEYFDEPTAAAATTPQGAANAINA